MSVERDEEHGAGRPRFGWVAICGRCGEPMHPKDGIPGVNDAAECPRCGLLVPGVVAVSEAVDLPPNLTPQQVRGILTRTMLRLAEAERKLDLVLSYLKLR